MENLPEFLVLLLGTTAAMAAVAGLGYAIYANARRRYRRRKR